METLSSMWTGHRARERIGVKITLSCSQWLHSLLQKQTYLECGHSLTLCSPCVSWICCLHQSQLWVSKWHPKASLWGRWELWIPHCDKKETFMVPEFISLWWISDWLFLLSSCSSRTVRQTQIESLLMPLWALQHDRAGCSKAARCYVRRSCTCINPSIFVFLYSIDVSINSV